MISVGRDGLLVKIMPSLIAYCSEFGHEDLAKFAGLPARECADVPHGVLLGRAAGSLAWEVMEAAIREWRERDEAQERHVNRQPKRARLQGQFGDFNTLLASARSGNVAALEQLPAAYSSLRAK